MTERKDYFQPELLGTNVELDICFLRHGPKDKDGNLTPEGRRRAYYKGQGMRVQGQYTRIKFFSSDMPRVLETQQAFAAGYQDDYILTPFEEDPYLSIDSVFFDHDKSRFLKRVRNDLREAFSIEDETERQQAVENAETLFLISWLAHRDKRPDEGTASPLEIARNMAYKIENHINEVDVLESNEHIGYLQYTHEYLIAPVIMYFVRGGEERLARRGRVDYLEVTLIKVKTDEARRRSYSVELSEGAYELDIDKIHEFANAKKQTLSSESSVSFE